MGWFIRTAKEIADRRKKLKGRTCNPIINRWTGKPHTHERERRRRKRRGW